MIETGQLRVTDGPCRRGSRLCSEEPELAERLVAAELGKGLIPRADADSSAHDHVERVGVVTFLEERGARRKIDPLDLGGEPLEELGIDSGEESRSCELPCPFPAAFAHSESMPGAGSAVHLKQRARWRGGS